MKNKKKNKSHIIFSERSKNCQFFRPNINEEKHRFRKLLDRNKAYVQYHRYFYVVLQSEFHLGNPC